MKIMAIGVFGVIGILLRYFIDSSIGNKNGFFPYATLTANIFGCFIAGFVSSLISQKFGSEQVLSAIIIGFCGGLTTFSALTLQTFNLLDSQAFFKASCYILISISLGLGSLYSGIKLSSIFLKS